ncbi:hypothetical protein FE257_010537 [Aspergillus nanangensis]|uniref:Uncharacterized protein n=1 Tax=Aspergillus nanangensis TaxID=2582783 RepID=A0AAD4CJQ4_ASPNN|nr:hypothetical protein FE257_010537 [Aspergillus nanangensis]
MSSTTLMTFLIATNPQIKSVKLFGSWDNFSKPYIMERDKRVGPGQWRGCHSFTNIICDGTPRDISSARSGGLKMGGTYWYYYLLDDDVEHYNRAEPVTSLCPLLPGQPVNVLQVPIILPDTRPIHTSNDSTTPLNPDQRTMNPEDKYMNPRRPPKPKLRLRTSPPLLQQSAPSWSFSTSPLNVITNKCVSQPGSASRTKKQESQKPARSVSPPRSRGLRAAFRQWNASSPDLNAAYNRDDNFLRPTAAHGLTAFGRHENSRLGAGGHSRMGSDNTTEHLSASRRTNHLLPRRPLSTGECGSMSLSIRDRRALNSKSTEQALHLNPLTVQTKPDITIWGTRSVYSHVSQGSSSSLDPLSLLPTATLPLQSEDAMTPTPFNFREKRLPTLPNSPSSVMDEALRDLEERERELDTENLGSHFSDFSATDDSIAGDSACERSHFSEWSTDTELMSPESMESSLMFNREDQHSPVPDTLEVPDLWKNGALAESGDPDTPNLNVTSKLSPTTVGGDSPRLDLPPPQLSGPFSLSDLDVPGLCIEDVDEVESNPKRHAAFFGAVETLETLGLVRSPESASIQFPENINNNTTSMEGVPSRDGKRHSKSSFPGPSATMQEMMDELSYLKNMIQSGTGGIEEI